MADQLYDPTYWRRRADEMRAMAQNMRDKISRDVILSIADDYEKLAMRVELQMQPKDNP